MHAPWRAGSISFSCAAITGVICSRCSPGLPLFTRAGFYYDRIASPFLFSMAQLQRTVLHPQTACCPVSLVLFRACYDDCRSSLPLTSTLPPSARPPPTMMEAACTTVSACHLAPLTRLATASQMAPATSLPSALERLALPSQMPWTLRPWLLLPTT